MQDLFSLLPMSMDGVEKAISHARMACYLKAAKGDRQLALRLYIWNARLCEALYLPMQFAEVTTRNAIKIPVEKRFGANWYVNHKFINLLPNRLRDELALAERKARKKHSTATNQDHITANLSFGFWVALMTAAYDKHLWMSGVKGSFPFASSVEDRQAIYVLLNALRRFRNDIAHHAAIFDRYPQREFQNALRVIKLICAETHWLASQTARVGQIISERPTV